MDKGTISMKPSLFRVYFISSFIQKFGHLPELDQKTQHLDTKAPASKRVVLKSDDAMCSVSMMRRIVSSKHDFKLYSETRPFTKQWTFSLILSDALVFVSKCSVF